MSDDARDGDAAGDRVAGEPGVDVEAEGVSPLDEGMIGDSEQADDDSSREDGRERRPWHEGPDDELPEESWLTLDDDELLHRIETLGSEEHQDEKLLEVVGSDRHFFVRQEAAKRIHDRTQLFAFEEDRHIGQILVRHLTRREDLTYLERLAIRCRHVEVRSAAQVQLARVWRWLETQRPPSGPTPTLPPPPPQPQLATSGPPLPPAAAAIIPSTAVLAREGVDASLLGWAAHFVVEHAWSHLGTTATRELLRRTQRELAATHANLGLFNVNEEARVITDAAAGARIPQQAVRELAVWMTAFRDAAREVAPDVHATSVRGCTALMADALRDAGFYRACDEAEARRRA
jgi:hypothetical protein